MTGDLAEQVLLVGRSPLCSMRLIEISSIPSVLLDQTKMLSDVMSSVTQTKFSLSANETTTITIATITTTITTLRIVVV